MKKYLLLLAVTTFVSTEADAQIPFALNGFRFPLAFNTPPIVYHKSPVHFYKVEEEEQAEKIECRNDEGSLVPCVHNGKDLGHEDRPMPGAYKNIKKGGSTFRIAPQPSAGSTEKKVEQTECRNNLGSLVPCARGEVLSHEDGQFNFIQKDGSVSRAVARGSWRVYAHSLLCNTPGSNEDKADEIKDRLKEDDSDANWIVFVSDNDEGSAFNRKTGDRVWHEDTCGKAMYVWRRDDSLFDKKSCSSTETSRMTTLMRAAAAGGGGNAAVRDRLVTEIGNFGYDHHFIRVASDTGNWRQRVYIYNSCGVSLKSNGYLIYVYMK